LQVPGNLVRPIKGFFHFGSILGKQGVRFATSASVPPVTKSAIAFTPEIWGRSLNRSLQTPRVQAGQRSSTCRAASRTVCRWHSSPLGAETVLAHRIPNSTFRIPPWLRIGLSISPGWCSTLPLPRQLGTGGPQRRSVASSKRSSNMPKLTLRGWIWSHEFPQPKLGAVWRMGEKNRRRENLPPDYSWKKRMELRRLQEGNSKPKKVSLHVEGSGQTHSVK